MAYQLSDFGSFMLPGREVTLSGQETMRVARNANMSIDVDPNGTYLVNNTYVEYFIPEPCVNTAVLIHGGGLCGNSWNKTPDGRDGWVQCLLKRHYGVYVVDIVERGRAGWCSLPQIWPEMAESRTAETCWQAFRLGDADGFATKKAYPRQQFPIDAFDNFVCYNVPRWNTHEDAQVAGLKQLFARLPGPCVIVAHSLGCNLAMQLLSTYAAKISHMIFLEPAGLGEVKFASTSLPKLLTFWGDYITGNPLWEPIYQQSVLYHKLLTKLSMCAEMISLPEQGIFGNSHMLMMDCNLVTIAELGFDWLTKT